jgi:hypothetical protein
MSGGWRHRYRATEITYGPVGRVVATLVVLGILWLCWQMGLFGLVAIVILASSGLVRQAFRDIWRRVPDAGEKAILDPPRPDLPDDYVPISEREAPRRG